MYHEEKSEMYSRFVRLYFTFFTVMLRAVFLENQKQFWQF